VFEKEKMKDMNVKKAIPESIISCIVFNSLSPSSFLSLYIVGISSLTLLSHLPSLSLSLLPPLTLTLTLLTFCLNKQFASFPPFHTMKSVPQRGVGAFE
jgi:hypothetical protein